MHYNIPWTPLSKRCFPSLAGLRALFALFIFLHHVDLFPAGGDFGVCFFFVVSGFLISYGYGMNVTDGSFKLKDFLKKRLRKIYPLHLICLLATVALGYWALTPKWVGVFALNAGLLQSWIPLQQVFFSGNPVSWFLSDILICYLVFPFVFRGVAAVEAYVSDGGKKERWVVILSAVILVGVYVAVISLIPENLVTGLIYIWPPLRIIDFSIGVCVAGFLMHYETTDWFLFYPNKITGMGIMTETSIIAVCGALIFIWGYIPERYSLVCVWWLPAAGIISTFYSSDQGLLAWLLSTRPFQWLGKISFSFFLIHVLVIRSVERFLPIEGEYSWLSILVTLAISIVLAAAIEKLLGVRWVRK